MVEDTATIDNKKTYLNSELFSALRYVFLCKYCERGFFGGDGAVPIPVLDDIVTEIIYVLIIKFKWNWF